LLQYHRILNYYYPDFSHSSLEFSMLSASYIIIEISVNRSCSHSTFYLNDSYTHPLISRCYMESGFPRKVLSEWLHICCRRKVIDKVDLQIEMDECKFNCVNSWGILILLNPGYGIFGHVIYCTLNNVIMCVIIFSLFRKNAIEIFLIKNIKTD
jgi:hypothetical protein